MRTLEGVLAGHPFFADLDPRYLQMAVGCAANMRFDAGDLVVREGEDASNFYLIREGQVTLEVFAPGRGAMTIETLETGDVLGWSWLIPPYRWRFDARATKPTRAIVFDGGCLRGKCEEDHELGYEMLKRVAAVLGHRLDGLRYRLLDLYRVDTPTA